MTGRKNLAVQVPLVVPYKALEKFSKALYGTTGGTCSARFFRPVMIMLMAPARICPEWQTKIFSLEVIT